ncbi:MAG: GNAT family N-acetyltransferase [Lapillicoccus sp.]
MAPRFTAAPLTPDAWGDLEALAERPGSTVLRSCWCMFYRRTGDFGVTVAAGPEHREDLRRIVDSGESPGLVGYVDGEPAGWISLGPRPEYPRLEASRLMPAVDDAPVWSFVCSFVGRDFRGQGVQRRLLVAAIDYARAEGVRTLEAYPVDKPGRSDSGAMWWGSQSLDEKAGFREVERRSSTRLVMRRTLRPRTSA